MFHIQAYQEGMISLGPIGRSPASTLGTWTAETILKW